LKETPVYSKTLFAGWADMDFNSHMRNTAFLDKSADVRMMFFAENGFPMSEFVRRRIGPVILRDEIEYRREIGLLQEFAVTLAIAGLVPDGGRFVMRNEFLRGDGTLCARVSPPGHGWTSRRESLWRLPKRSSTRCVRCHEPRTSRNAPGSSAREPFADTVLRVGEMTQGGCR
jgi:acyl-CoA thioester hydrolase